MNQAPSFELRFIIFCSPVRCLLFFLLIYTIIIYICISTGWPTHDSSLTKSRQNQNRNQKQNRRRLSELFKNCGDVAVWISADRSTKNSNYDSGDWGKHFSSCRQWRWWWRWRWWCRHGVVEFKFCIALIAALSSSPARAPFPNHLLAKCRLLLFCACSEPMLQLLLLAGCIYWWWYGVVLLLVGTSTHSRKTIFKLERFCTSPTPRVRPTTTSFSLVCYFNYYIN